MREAPQEAPKEEVEEGVREQRVVVRREAMVGWEERLGAAIREDRDEKSCQAIEKVAQVKMNIERNLLFDDILTKRNGSKSVFARLGKRSEVTEGSKRKEKRPMKLETEEGKRAEEVVGGRGKGKGKKKDRTGKGCKARMQARRREARKSGKRGGKKAKKNRRDST